MSLPRNQIGKDPNGHPIPRRCEHQEWEGGIARQCPEDASYYAGTWLCTKHWLDAVNPDTE